MGITMPKVIWVKDEKQLKHELKKLEAPTRLLEDPDTITIGFCLYPHAIFLVQENIPSTVKLSLTLLHELIHWIDFSLR